LNGKSKAEKILLTSIEITAPLPFVSDGAVIFYETFSPSLLLFKSNKGRILKKAWPFISLNDFKDF